jgi:hypothetical protein
MYAKLREHGAPVQGARPGEETRDLSPNQRVILPPESFSVDGSVLIYLSRWITYEGSAHCAGK